MNPLIRIILLTSVPVFSLFNVKILANPASPGVQYPNGTAAIVDNRVITMEDLHRKLSPFVRQLQRECRSNAEFQEKLTPLAQEVLDRMIDDILLVNSFTSDKNLKIPESYLENHYAKFLVEHFQGNRSEYHEFLKAEGKTDREIREQQKEEVMIGFLRSRMKKSEATISPTQVQKYYNEHQNEFQQKESIHLRQIVIKTPTKGDDADSPEKIYAVMDQLKKGVPFQDVAKEFSEDDMKKSGGDWGWINRSDIREELAKVAFTLNKSQYSSPVTLNDHTFILFVEDKKSSGLIPLTEVSDKIEKTLAADQAKQAEAQIVQKLRKKAYIRYYL